MSQSPKFHAIRSVLVFDVNETLIDIDSPFGDRRAPRREAALSIPSASVHSS